ncbi:MAG: WG repeat-containing protein [Acidobacteria bacterium]|nr:WG repeat-containing protein [Acidobacteriota bacterium]
MFREGLQIGVYTLIGKLGKGGFGEVWLAEKRSPFVTKKVAVKLPLDEQVNFEAIRQEATLWEQASGHPNVLPIIDADVYDGQVVIVSEYAEGGSLSDRLRREGRLPVKEAVEMTLGILSGLEFLHSRRIIHRDIKPQNILLQGNTPRLADFGISRAMQTTVVSSTIIGTDAYMSPESFDGKRTVQTDIWAVGVVLYQLLMGRLPFPQEHPSERMFAVLTKDFEPLGDEIPEALRRIVARALAKLPENRYATTSEMRDELSRAHVSLAHPTLVKTEVLRFPAGPTISAGPPPAETEKVTFVKSAPAPPETLPAAVSNSIVTQIAPEKEAVREIHDFPAAADEKKTAPVETKERSSLYVMGITGALAIALILFAMYASNRKQLERFTDDAGKYGFKDSFGRVVIPPKYDDADTFSDDMAAVKLNGKWGFINLSGELVIPLKFDNKFHFSENLAAVQLNGKWGFVDKKGDMKIPCRFSDFGYFLRGQAVVCLNGKGTGSCGIIDNTGKEMIPLEYDNIYEFWEDLAAVQKNRKWGFIDKNNVLVIPYKYDTGGFFVNGYANVELAGRKIRIDKKGNEAGAVNANGN